MNKAQALKLIWSKTHNDFKGKINGHKTILVCRGGTVLIKLDDMTDEEIKSRCPQYIA